MNQNPTWEELLGIYILQGKELCDCVIKFENTLPFKLLLTDFLLSCTINFQSINNHIAMPVSILISSSCSLLSCINRKPMEHTSATETNDITVAPALLMSPELIIAYYYNIWEIKTITGISRYGKFLLIWSSMANHLLKQAMSTHRGRTRI